MRKKQTNKQTHSLVAAAAGLPSSYIDLDHLNGSGLQQISTLKPARVTPYSTAKPAASGSSLTTHQNREVKLQPQQPAQDWKLERKF